MKGRALALCLVVVGALAGCGDDAAELPPGTIVAVDDAAITKRDLVGQMKADSVRPSDADGRAHTLSYLILDQWLAREAERRDLDSDLETLKDAAVRQAAPDQSPAVARQAFAKVVRDSGSGEREYLRKLRYGQLQERFVEKVPIATAAEIDRWLAKRKHRFDPVEQRDLQVVLTHTRAKAIRAKRELEQGKPWKVVAARYSLPQRTSSAAAQTIGGSSMQLSENKGEEALNEVAFAVEPGTLAGPIRTQFGWYLLRVRAVRMQRETEARIEEVAKSTLRFQRMHRIRERFVDDYRSETRCAKGYVVPQCGGSLH